MRAGASSLKFMTGNHPFHFRFSNFKNHFLFFSVVEGLKKIYKKQILPLEQNYFFHDFHSPELSDPDFDARPMILLVGQVYSDDLLPVTAIYICTSFLKQYSTGKTTFIRYLLERDFDGNNTFPALLLCIFKSSF